ncbi:Rhs family protein [gamma proteobacterium IMCC1989]|nr:Rhs family protein [gamma proteobacterium IMCC1989]
MKYNDEDNQAYYAGKAIAEVLLPIESYRGYGNSNNKLWIPLAPWKKEYKTTVGLDLFPDNEIPPELNFDFDAYVTTIKQKTALELYEKQLQAYLDVNHPNKTLKDIGYTQTIIKNSTSVLPLSLPIDALVITEDATSENFSNIPNEHKYKVTYYIKKYQSEQKVLEYDLYISEISTSRVVLDFIPYDTANANKIAPYKLIAKTPDGAALVKAVLKVDGAIVANSSALTIGDYFVDGQEIYDDVEDRPRKKVGVVMSLGIDNLVASEKMIERWKAELSTLSLGLLDNDYTKEEYLGRYLSIISRTYNYRQVETRRKIDNYFSMRRNYVNSIRFNRTYTFAKNININQSEKFTISNSMSFDDIVENGNSVYKFATDERVDFYSDIRKLMGGVYIYNASYNEGLIFEDWQSTPGGSTIKALMVAHEQNIPVVTLTKDDIENGHLYILENQTNNRYHDYTIQSIIEELQADNSGRQSDTVTLPVQELKYEGAILRGRITPSSFLFSIDNGGLNNGGGSVYTPRAINLSTRLDFSELSGGVSNAAFSDSASSSSDGDGGSDDFTFQSNYEWTYREPSFDGDPVDMLTGEFYQEEISDIALKSTSNNLLDVRRTYKSQLSYNGVFGYGWAWNHMDRMIKSDDNSLLYVDENARFSVITPNGDSTYTYPDGASYTLAFANNQYTITQKEGDKTVFDINGLLLEKVDTNGNKILFEHNDQHNIKTIKDSHGRMLSLTYNANNKVTSVTDGQGLTTAYTYDEDDLIAYSDAEGNTTSYEYLKNQENPANNHNMSKYTLPNGDYLELVYYKNDQVSHHTNKQGDTFNFQYSRYNQYAETWNEEGYYRKVFFNDSGDVIRIDKKDGTLELKEYDADHNLIAYTDANGNKSAYTYDAQRNMLTKTNALNETVTYEYEATFNKLTKETDSKGNVVSYFYDNSGNVTRIVDALLHETHYEYDSVGNQIKIIDALANETIRSYDSTGTYLLTQTDKEGNTTTYTYDNAGNVTSVTNAEGHVQQTQYNKNNQVVEQSDANGDSTLYEYNENKKLVKKTLANGAVYEYAYYAAKDIVVGNLLEQEIDPLGYAVQYAYDKLGNKTEVTDKNGNTTHFTYNELKKVSSKTAANGHTTYYHYDGLGNLVKEVSTKRNDYDTVDIITTYTYDEASRLISKTIPSGQSFHYEYDANGNRIIEKYTINDQEVVTSYAYNALNKPIEVIQGVGTIAPRITTIEYDALHRKVKQTNAIGISTSYVYDNNSNLLEERVEGVLGEEVVEGTDSLRIVKNEYNTLNQLIRQTDANGNSTNYAYNVKGQLLSKTDALNHRYVYSYDEVGNKIQEHLPTGGSIKYSYDAINNLTQQTNPLGHSQYLEYDPNGNVTKIIDAKGNVTLFAYNGINQQVAKTDSLGNMSTLTYDELGNKTSEVNEEGDITEYEYDIHNNVIQKRQLLSYSSILQTDFVYDTLNRLTSIVDAKNNATSYIYNIFNEKITTSDALTQTISQEFDDVGRVVRVTDKKGIITEMGYDVLGRVISSTQASSSSDEIVSHFTYDNVGNRLSVVQGVGSNIITTRYAYDALNRQVSTTVNNALVASQAYDAIGNVVSQTDANGNATQLTYDANNQLIQHTNAKGHSSTFTYDENGNQLSQTSPEGFTVINEYDALNRLFNRQVGDAQQALTYEYDKASRVITERDFNGHKSIKEYDALGRVVKDITAENTIEEAVTQYTYDENSNLLGIQNANEKWVTYDYDALNRKIKHTFASGAYQEFSYDKNDNLEATIKKDNTTLVNIYDDLDRLINVEVDGVIEQEYAYDALSRLVSSKDHNQGRKTNSVAYEYDHLNNIIQSMQNGKVIHKAYDANSNLTKITADSFVVDNTYDNLNTLSTIKANAVAIADFVYDNDRRRSAVNTANGVSLDISFDKRSRESERAYVSSASSTLFEQTTIYDLNSNVIQETITQNNQTLIKGYQYDAQDRLTADDQKDHYFTYDRNGNITGTNQNGFVETRTVDSDDQYTALFGSSDQITYDLNGNITRYNSKTFSYDYANRLIEVEEAGQVIASYTYDAENRRIEKILSDKTITYLYDSNQVLQEYEDDQLTNTYIYSDNIDDPIAYIYNGETYYYLKDRQYSIQAITNSAGEIVESYQYSAFGKLTIVNQENVPISGSTINNSFTYTGRRFDAETGLYYYRNRMYNAELGRFISEDPVGYKDGYNLYQYAKNNPLKYYDPMGTTARTTSQPNYPGGFNYPAAASPYSSTNSWSDFVGSYGSTFANNSVGTTAGSSNGSSFSFSSLANSYVNTQVSAYEFTTGTIYNAGASLAGGLSFLGTYAATGGDVAAAQYVQSSTQASFSYEYRSGGAQSAASTLGNLGSAYSGATTRFADSVYNVTGSPTLGAIAKVAPDALLEFGTYGVGRSLSRGGGTVDVYRAFGGDARAQGFSWTTKDPRTVSNFRDAAGLPSGGASGATNTAEFLIKGKVKASDVIKFKSADPLDGYKGGLPELIIDPNNVNITDFSVLKP